MERTLEIIVDYVRGHAPRTAQASDVSALPVYKTLDSIAMMDFIAFLERSFSIRIGDADVLPENFETFADVARLVESKRG
jgi:acyl carrier protein